MSCVAYCARVSPQICKSSYVQSCRGSNVSCCQAFWWKNCSSICLDLLILTFWGGRRQEASCSFQHALCIAHLFLSSFCRTTWKHLSAPQWWRFSSRHLIPSLQWCQTCEISSPKSWVWGWNHALCAVNWWNFLQQLVAEAGSLTRVFVEDYVTWLYE